MKERELLHDKRVTILMNDLEYKKFLWLVDSTGKSKSDLVRDLIIDEVMKIEKKKKSKGDD